jgi:hypothetical protein
VRKLSEILHGERHGDRFWEDISNEFAAGLNQVPSVGLRYVWLGLSENFSNYFFATFAAV